MAANADSVVVELIAKTEQLDKPVQQSAATFDASMDKITASATKAEAAVTRSSSARSSALQRESAQISQFSTILSRDMDVVGAKILSSNSPFVAPVKQAPQVSAAMGLMATGGTLLSSVLGGVLITAGAAAIAMLVELITKTDDTTAAIAAAVEKLKQDAHETENARRAKAIFAETLEGVTKALNDNEDALKRLNDQDKTAAFLALRAAIASKLRLDGIRNETQALLDQARAQLEVNNAQAGLEHVRGTADPRLVAADDARKRIDELQKKLDSTTAQITRSQQQIAEASSRVATEAAERMSDASERIKTRYASLIEQTRQRLVNEKASSNEIARQTALLLKQRDAELEALKAKKQRVSTGSGEFGRQIGFDDAASIARSAGLTVTSAYRSTAHQAELYNDPSVNRPGNPVARPGTSAHEGVNGKWALDIAFAPGLTAQSLKKLYGDQGVSLSAVYKEAGHFHIEGSRSQAAQQEQAAARVAKQEEARIQAYLNEKAGLESQVLEARKALGLSAQEVADIETAAVKLAHDRYESNITALAKEGKLHEDEFNTLKQSNDDLEKYRLQMVAVRKLQTEAAEKRAAGQNATNVEAGLLQAQQDALRSQEGLAKTAGQRRVIEDRLIDLQFAEEKLQLLRQIQIAADLKALADKTKSQEDIAAAAQAEADAAIAKRQAARPPATAGRGAPGQCRQNAAPLQSYFNSIPDTAAEINDAFENIAVHGLQTFNDALTNAIVNYRSLGDVGRAVLQGLEADLIKLALQLIEQHTIGAALGTASTAAATAQAAALGAAWAGPAALASLASYGANAIPAQAA
jgi:hypothetical protein